MARGAYGRAGGRVMLPQPRGVVAAAAAHAHHTADAVRGTNERIVVVIRAVAKRAGGAHVRAVPVHPMLVAAGENCPLRRSRAGEGAMTCLTTVVVSLIREREVANHSKLQETHADEPAYRAVRDQAVSFHNLILAINSSVNELR